MMIDAATVWLGVAVALVLVVVGLAKQRTWHLDTAFQHIDRFETAARAVADTPKVSARIVDSLAFMASTIGEGWVGRIIFWYGWTGQLREWAQNPPEDSVEFDRELAKMSKAMQKQYDVAATEYLLAVSYRNLLLGGPIRRFLLFDASENPRSLQKVVSDVEHGQSHCLPAAAT